MDTEAYTGSDAGPQAGGSQPTNQAVRVPPAVQVSGGLPEAWPALPLVTIDTGWQAAFNAGTAQVARQIAFALAFSRQCPPVQVSTPELPAAQAATTAGAVALAAVADVLGVSERLSLLDDLMALDDPAAQARGLMNIAPALSIEKRRAVLRRAYELASQAADPLSASRLLTDLLPLLRQSATGELPGGLVAETLDIASQVRGMHARLRSLTALAPYLPATVRIALLLAVLDNIATMRHVEAQSAALIALAPHLLGEVQHRALTVATHIQNAPARARALTALAQHLPPRLQARLRAAALDAIESITNEHERAQALAAFAPHLEQADEDNELFPALLERALALAVGLTRPEARAEALVGLQARLPRHLQGEALGVVKQIENEQHRARLLAALAPGLPVDLVVAEALTIARELRQRDARFEALCALGIRLDGVDADRVWSDALTVALALPRQLEQVMALCELAPHLPPQMRARTLKAALTTARAISRERAQLRAISALAPLVASEDQMLADLVADARKLTNPLEKVGALIALLPYLPAPMIKLTLDEILALLLEINLEYRQARALGSIAAYLEDDHLTQALAIASRIQDPFDRATTLGALLLRVADEERYAGLLADALTAAHSIVDHYDRATALSNLRELMPESRRGELTQPLLNAVRQIEDDYDRASGIALLAPVLAEQGTPAVLPQESQVLRDALLAACRLDDACVRAHALTRLIPAWLEAYPARVGFALWCEVLVQLSRRPPGHLLSDITALIPVVRHLGGQSAVVETASVLAHARHW